MPPGPLDVALPPEAADVPPRPLDAAAPPAGPDDDAETPSAELDDAALPFAPEVLPDVPPAPLLVVADTGADPPLGDPRDCGVESELEEPASANGPDIGRRLFTGAQTVCIDVAILSAFTKPTAESL